jgi:hypothetical protein
MGTPLLLLRRETDGTVLYSRNEKSFSFSDFAMNFTASDINVDYKVDADSVVEVTETKDNRLSIKVPGTHIEATGTKTVR